MLRLPAMQRSLLQLALMLLVVHQSFAVAIQFEPTWVDLAPPSAARARFASVEGAGAKDNEVQPFSIGDPSQGCLQVPFGVCIGDREAGGTSVLAGWNTMKGVVGAWNFDDIAAQDASGNRNNVSPIPQAGPGATGVGASAHIKGQTSKWLHKIPHHSSYSSLEHTISFSVFLLSTPGEAYATIFHKGTATTFCPSISLDTNTKKIRVKISTGAKEDQFSTLDSKSRVQMRRWTQITLVVQIEVVRLYINGVLDGEMLLPSSPLYNKEPIFLGRDPYHGQGVDMYMDDIKIYSRRVAASDLSTIGDSAFSGIGSGFVQLGCQSCSFDEARKSCKSGYHLCTEQEQSAGALLVARVMGWADSNVKIWTAPVTAISGSGSALCCVDSAA